MEMRVQWVEVWTMFAVRYTYLILVYFIAVTEAPNPCSGHILAPIPQSGSGSPTSVVFRRVMVWRTVSCSRRLIKDSFLGVRFSRICRIGSQKFGFCSGCVTHALSLCTSHPVAEAHSPCSGHTLTPIRQSGSTLPSHQLPVLFRHAIAWRLTDSPFLDVRFPRT
jgi:hypothetical protein